MKYVFFVLLYFVCVDSNAQTKKDNVIKVKAGTTIGNLKAILFNNGFTIEGTDTSFFTTTAKALPNHNATLKLQIARLDSTVIIKGLSKISADLPFFGIDIKSEYEQVEYSKAKNCIYCECWKQMQNVAFAISPNVEYSKQ